MYPVLFHIGKFPISTFGLMMATAFLVGSWITARRMKEVGLDPDLATTLLVYVMLGGILGSKLYFAIDVSIREDKSFTELLFDRSGITWYGGLILGTVIGAIGARIHGVSVVQMMNCVAPAVAVGQAIGRVGCFLVGDDYGKESNLPWAVSFPEGSPPTGEGIRVHPTQLYEVFWLLPVAFVLWKRRDRSPFLFGEYIIANGLGRFAIETLRTNERVLLGLTEAQLVGLALVAGGSAAWLYFRTRQAAVTA
jgi:phosphatidylglycerol---prolipoprotein diacylglyceryl transferase